MADQIDFESFQETGSVSESNLEFLAETAKKLNDLKSELKRLEEEAKDVKRHIKTITEEVIPNYMRELGLSEVKLENGAKVTVKDQVFASIPKPVQDAALQWLDDNGHGSLIKNEIKLNFAKGEDERAQTLRKILEDAGYEFNHTANVHWQTLRAFCREQLEQGNMLPEDLFSVHVIPTATIKEGK